MPTRQQQNTTPLRTISDFKSRLSGGGARPNLFEVELAFPNAVLSPNKTIPDPAENITELILFE